MKNHPRPWKVETWRASGIGANEPGVTLAAVRIVDAEGRTVAYWGHQSVLGRGAYIEDRRTAQFIVDAVNATEDSGGTRTPA